MNIANLLDESDTSDEDYLPPEHEDLPSEVDSDGNLENHVINSENPEGKVKKRKKKTSKAKKKVDKEESGSKENEHQEKEVSKEDRKKKDDDLWADFMKDTGFKPKNSIDMKPSNLKKSNADSSKLADISTKETSQKSPEKVKITQVFQFAGEEVKVEKEVAVDSAEARLLNQAVEAEVPKTSRGKRSGGLSGISNVLSQLGKKPKISTLEKSKLDWDKFKKEENIEEELQMYNKGKDGYLEKQDFLQRADLRTFEVEKDIRTVERNKRFNSTL